tara:strand:- start:4129 stop:4764 length:636 start_codon:yes stop_codon:yes gene_type:complete
MGKKSKLGKIIDMHGLSQKELAMAVNVTPASVNRWCNITDGRHTQFEYKLIPEIINFFKSKGLTDIRPNEILDLEQFGIEKESLKIKGEIITENALPGQIRLLQEDSSYNPKFNMSGDFYLIRERKNTNHLWYYIIDNSIKYKPDDNLLIDLPGVVYFKNQVNRQPILMSKISRNGNILSNDLDSGLLALEEFKMENISFVQLALGVEYSK